MITVDPTGGERTDNDLRAKLSKSEYYDLLISMLDTAIDECRLKDVQLERFVAGANYIKQVVYATHVVND